ncbi:hypothetical protein F0L74_28165 [Chitinophaga agrisoli]|uniref:Uncharacterized protein n=1 Tax=Chitinophaga agrisoli TaxID=2607653 RepID=A0A5B2VN06_9BACT|nr:hypothetical protein [Chitinophaga agrisoli]KAA2240050.1 hypothetical protein F0L74_28165 [Chitinophaga agrisoli]
MKMTNKDVVRLAEIKLYFLDPPYSFKIHSEAAPQLDEIFAILEKYKPLPLVVTDNLQTLKTLFADASGNVEATRKVMRQIASVLNGLNRA